VDDSYKTKELPKFQMEVGGGGNRNYKKYEKLFRREIKSKGKAKKKYEKKKTCYVEIVY
jgi:hypothetical protein